MKVVFFLSSFLFYSISYSALPLEGWYSGLMLSGTNSSDLEFNVVHPLTRKLVLGQINYKPALNGGGQIGYRYDKCRFETQFFYNHNNFEKVLIDDISLSLHENLFGLIGSGHTNFYAIMFNAFYEIYEDDREVKVVPYLGLGIGFAAINNTYSVNHFENEIFARKDSASAPMGQVIAGLNYFFTDSYSAGFDFRYMRTPQHQTLNSSVAVGSINLIVNLSFT